MLQYVTWKRFYHVNINCFYRRESLYAIFEVYVFYSVNKSVFKDWWPVVFNLPAWIGSLEALELCLRVSSFLVHNLSFPTAISHCAKKREERVSSSFKENAVSLAIKADGPLWVHKVEVHHLLLFKK